MRPEALTPHPLTRLDEQLSLPLPKRVANRIAKVL